MYTIKTKSAFRNKPGVISGELIGCNYIHAFAIEHVKWFETELQAQKYIDRYLSLGYNASVVDFYNVVSNSKTYFD